MSLCVTLYVCCTLIVCVGVDVLYVIVCHRIYLCMCAVYHHMSLHVCACISGESEWVSSDLTASITLARSPTGADCRAMNTLYK